MVFALIMYILGLEIRYRDGMVVNKNSFQAFLFAARPNTLTASVAPVLVGATASALEISPFKWIPYLLCLVFAIGMQIASNLINDYFDFKNGADDKKLRLGPPRACSMGWVDADVMKKWIRLVIFLSLIGGFPLVFYGGWNLIVIGVVCVLFAFLYTTFFASKGMGDVLVLFFFGIIPVNFTYYLETGFFSVDTLVISVGVGLIVDTLLIVNNYRDYEQDEKNGKRTMAVIVGRDLMPSLYLISGIVGFCLTFIMFSKGIWLPSAILSPYLLMHVLAYKKIRKIEKGKELNKVLEASATNIFVFGFLLSAGFLLEKFLC